jgi:hypothetical protein
MRSIFVCAFILMVLSNLTMQQMVPLKISEPESGERGHPSRKTKTGDSEYIEMGSSENEEEIGGLGREMPINQNFFNDLKKKNLNIHFLSEEELEKVVFELKHSVLLFQNPE